MLTAAVTATLDWNGSVERPEAAVLLSDLRTLAIDIRFEIR